MREPVVLAAAAAAIVQAVVILATNNPDVALPDLTQWLIPAATAVAAWFGRQRVMPTATIRDAGINPEVVKERAENPNVVPYREPAG